MKKQSNKIVLLEVLAATCFALAMGVPTQASAASDSVLTLGVGTSMNLEGQSQVSGTLKGRLRLLWALGAELSYEPATADVEHAAMGVHGLLYLVPTSVFGGYLKAGFTNARLGTLGTDEDRYEVGGGMEIYFGEHVAVGAEYLRSFPNPHVLLGETIAAEGDVWSVGQDVWSMSVWWFI